MLHAKPLTVSNISFQYPSRELNLGAQSLIQNLSFTLNPGSMLHIQGPNGSGKTTLLKLLAGLYRPDEGRIQYGDQDIWFDLRTYHQFVQYLGHKNGFNPELTPLEHCHLDWAVVPESEKMLSQLNDLGLLEVKDRPGHLLSAGQKRRVALLRLFFCPALIWLLDEPLVALDQHAVALLMDRMQTHTEQGGLVIYTSHQSLPWRASVTQDIVLCPQ